MSLPRLIVLDVNETLSDLSGLREAFTAVGLAEHEVQAWFAGVLRDGFALTVTGANPGFADLAAESLAIRLARQQGDPADSGAAVEQVMSAFTDLAVHPDVTEGLAALHSAGVRVITLSNGGTGVAEALLERADALGSIERLLSVADAPAWKPDARAYHHATQTCGVEPAEAMLVAVHPWDIHGAHAAGLATAWIDRSTAGGYPSYFTPADVVAPSLVDLAEQLSR